MSTGNITTTAWGDTTYIHSTCLSYSERCQDRTSSRNAASTGTCTGSVRRHCWLVSGVYLTACFHIGYERRELDLGNEFNIS